VSLPESVQRALAGRGFAAYEGRELGGHEELRGRFLGLVEELLADHPEELERIDAHLAHEWTQDRFYDGVSRARPDRNLNWEQQVAEIRARSSHVGAVQLELGAWSRFPDERRDYHVERDGLAEFIRLDIDPDCPVDVVADARKLPFRDKSIDRISADSLFEHVRRPEEMLREMVRVLRPGGAARIATPFIFNLHGCPDDYLRYTPSWYEESCREAGFESVATDMDAARGLYYTLHNSAKAAVVADDQPDALRTLHLLVIELLGILPPLDDAFHNGSRQWFHSVRCLALKAGPLEVSHRERRDGPFADRCLDLLACPDCHGALRAEGGELVCSTCGLVYPVRDDGVPDFLSPSERPARARLLRRRPRPAVRG
jgi:uncharacterized protein YbaR (Trm112 family)